MRFEPGQEVTPNTRSFKIFGVSEEAPITPPEFGKSYIVEGYNPNILCGHGRPVLYLKEFPPTYIFCETSFDALPKLKLCDLPAGVSNFKPKPMGKKRHIADSTLTLPPPVEKKSKWYPKGNTRTHKANECPCCNGTGEVVDMKTHQPRNCTVCSGKGTIK